MKRWQRRALFSLLAVLIAAPLLFAISMYAGAWYYRIQAEKLLACVRSLQPGVTTETDFLKAIRPLHLKVSEHREVAKDDPLKVSYDYYFFNFPSWTHTLVDHIPEPVMPVVDHLMLDWTMFSASLQFEGSKLTKLHAYEYQAIFGGGHPFSGTVTIYAGRVSEQEADWSYPSNFEGYNVRSLDITEDQNGQTLARALPFHRYVYLDERATSEQRRKALEFHLECFTSLAGCRDASRILNPVPVR